MKTSTSKPSAFGRGLPAFFLLLLLVACWPSSPASGETVKISGVRGDLELSVQLPPNFDAAKAYSVLVGPGDYYWQDQPPRAGWILVTGEAFFGPDRIENAKRTLAWLRGRYKIQGDRFHIAGWSANSAGVFEIAMTYSKDFHSVTGIAGMPGGGSESKLAALQGTRVQFIVGENDAYWRRGSEDWHKKMKKVGIASTLEIIPNGAHVMPEISGAPFFERMNRLVKEIEAGQ